MANFCKFYKEVRQVSYDSGVTWISLDEYQKGDLYETDSPDCGGGITQYRWVNVSGQYTCVSTTKYQKTKKQQSTDGGSTWTDVSPIEYSTGAVIEYNSEDCGYVPSYKLVASYEGGQTYSLECNSSSALTTADTRPNGYTPSAMTSAVIGDCVTSIGNVAFSGCTSLSSVTIPNSVTSIGNSTFFKCISLTSVTIPNSVATIDGWAFEACSGLTSINIPNSVTSIGIKTFNYCVSLTSVTIGSGITSIPNAAFERCSSLTSVTIPNSVTTIEAYAFSRCTSLTSATIPSGVTTIEAYAFTNCTSLTSVTIPNSVTTIGQEALYSGTSLTSITIEATTPPTLGSNAFTNTNNCPIYVPSGSVNAYKSAWSEYSSRIQAI